MTVLLFGDRDVRLLKALTDPDGMIRFDPERIDWTVGVSILSLSSSLVEQLDRFLLTGLIEVGPVEEGRKSRPVLVTAAGREAIR